MGFFTRRRAEAISAERQMSVGPWLQEAVTAHPILSPASLVVAALGRIRFNELLRNATTYVGVARDIGIGERIASSSPSELAVRAIGTHLVTLSLGSWGVMGDQLRAATDWVIALGLEDDLMQATVTVGEMTMVGTDVENEKQLNQTMEAISDVLSSGVAMVTKQAGNDTRPSSLLEHADFKPLWLVERVTTGPPPVPATLGAQVVEQLERVVGPAQRAALGNEWPLLRREGDSWLVLARCNSALGWVGAAMFEALQAADAQKDTASVEMATAALRALNATVTAAYVDCGDRQPLAQVASAAQELPAAVAVRSPMGSRAAMLQLAAAALPMVGVQWKTSKLPKAKKLRFAAQAAMSDIPGLVLGYGLLQRDPKAAGGLFTDRVRPPQWELTFDHVDQPDSGRELHCKVTALTHSSAPGLVGSHALLALLDALSDHGQLYGSDVELLVANRDRSWSGSL